MPAKEVSRLLLISKRSVHRYCGQFMATGTLQPRHHRSGPCPKLSEQDQLILIDLVLTRPGIYLYELQRELVASTGTFADCSTICRFFKKIGVTRQKFRHIALQRSEENRGKFLAEMSMYEPSMFLWVDETGCDKRKLQRTMGYGIRGIPPRDHTFKLCGKRYSVIAVMSVNGVEDIYIHEGNVNGEVFVDFVRKCLLPILMPYNGQNPSSVVIMDNASIHKRSAIQGIINGVGALLRFLPVYSPDLNPIEEVFAEVKGFLTANDGVLRVTKSPQTLITMAFCSIRKENCISYVNHAGYF